MSPEQQKEIVTSLCNSVRDMVLEHIDEHNIPEEWDGLELRQLLAEVFWRERGFRFGRLGNYNPGNKRVKEYRSLVLAENLDRPLKHSR